MASTVFLATRNTGGIRAGTLYTVDPELADERTLEMIRVGILQPVEPVEPTPRKAAVRKAAAKREAVRQGVPDLSHVTTGPGLEG